MNKNYLIITIVLTIVGLIVYNYAQKQGTVRIDNLQKTGLNRYSATLTNNSPIPLDPSVKITVSDIITDTEKRFSFKIDKLGAYEAKDIEFTIDEPQKNIALKSVSLYLVSRNTSLSRSITDITFPNNKFTNFLALSPFVFGVGLLVLSRLV